MVPLAIAENEMKAYPQCTWLRGTRSGRGPSNVFSCSVIISSKEKRITAKERTKEQWRQRAFQRASYIPGLRTPLPELWLILVTATSIAVTLRVSEELNRYIPVIFIKFNCRRHIYLSVGIQTEALGFEISHRSTIGAIDNRLRNLIHIR